MRRTTWRWLLPAIIALAGWADSAAAWHGKGHQRATRLAISVLPKDVPEFFGKGAASVAHCAVDPDLFKKPIAADEVNETEGPEHYFDLERLGGENIPPRRFGLMKWCGRKNISPTKVGMVPYSVTEWTQRLTVAFAEHRKWPENEHIRSKCLVYAGILSHYAQDLCMPLHTTIHYDGRAKPDGSSPKTGIHLKVDALLEKLPQPAGIRIATERVRPFKNLLPAVIDELKASHALVERVYQLKSHIPALKEPRIRDKDVAEFTRERLRASALFTARLFLTAWKDSADIEFPKWHQRPTGTKTPPDRSSATARIEQVRLATYNVEHFMRMFDQVRMPQRSRNRTELFRDEEDLYEVARTITLKHFDPDVLVLQECCNQKMLEMFNQRWLKGKYTFVRVFAGNTDGQWLGVLVKPGFKVLEVQDRYYRQQDPVNDPAVRQAKEKAKLAEGNLLFPRGPVFLKVRTPGGNLLWVGNTHLKSKYGNDEAVTRWRIRQMQCIRRICGQLLERNETKNLVVMGDFNDDLGKDEHERKSGADAVAVMVKGKGFEQLASPTFTLVQADPALATYHCRIKPIKYRSFLDHVFLSPKLSNYVKATFLIRDPIAVAASDHYPVITVLELPRSGANAHKIIGSQPSSQSE